MLRTLWVLGKHTWQNFLYHNGTLQAAAISYYVLFSIIPMVILLGGVLGFVITDDARRERLEEHILDALPLNSSDGRDAVSQALDTLENARGIALIVGFGGTLWTASAAFSAIRRSLNALWDVYEQRPFVTSKLVDFAQMGMLGLILVASFVLTGVITAVRELSSSWFDFFNDTALWEIPGAIVPMMLIFIAFVLMYRFVPAVRPAWRPAAGAAALAAVATWALSNGFAFYVANFNNFDAVYGTIAGILLFLLFTNMAANILLVCGELSRTLHEFLAGELEALIHPAGPQPSLMEQTIRAVKGMFVRQP